MVGKEDQQEPPAPSSAEGQGDPQSSEASPPESSFTDELVTVPSAVTPGEGSDRTRRFDDARPILELSFPVPLDPPQREGALGRMGCYEILNVIGRGGMGIVARAFDEQLHRNVAIKVMSHQLIANERAHRRFLREARAAASINHPNVVTIHAVSEKDDTPYLVMEYVDGQPLQARIQKDAPLPYEDVLRIGAQIASGLAAAHRHGIIHRDIKPGNVMLEDGIERVKLTDFGLARLAAENSDLTSMGDLVGTPAYMSPEQVDGKELTPSSDLFSLGCVLYAMLAGKSPFHSSTGFATAHRVRVFDPAPISSLVDNVPAEFEQLVSRLLSKNPKGRPRSAESVAATLLEWSARTHQVRLSGSRQIDGASKAETETNRWLPVRLGGVAVILALLIGGGIWSRIRSTPPAPTRVGATQAEARLADGILRVHPKRGEFPSLSAALAAAQPQTTIELLPGRYFESVRINDSTRLAGVRIVGQEGVRIAGPPNAPVLHISNIPNCELRGFVLESSGIQNGVTISGHCPGLRIDNVRFESSPREESLVGMLHFEEGGSGSREAPMEVLNCWFDAKAAGMVLGSFESDALPVEHLYIHHNRVSTASKSYGVPIVVQGPFTNLRIERNLILRGHSGMSLLFHMAEDVKEGHIRHNTLAGVDIAFDFNISNVDQDVRIEENLVAGARTLNANAGDPAQYATWFSGNQWVATAEVERDLVEQMFELISAEEVESLDPESPAFAKPSPRGRGSLTGIHSDTR